MGLSRRSKRRYSSREEAIEHEIIDPIRQEIMKPLSKGGYNTAVMYRSVDAIADEVLRDERGGYARKVGERKFWDVVGANIVIKSNHPAVLEALELEREYMMRVDPKESVNVESELWPIGTALVCGIVWGFLLYICAVTGNI
jgi:hypothetical protein